MTNITLEDYITAWKGAVARVGKQFQECNFSERHC